jgi:glucokinase
VTAQDKSGQWPKYDITPAFLNTGELQFVQRRRQIVNLAQSLERERIRKAASLEDVTDRSIFAGQKFGWIFRLHGGPCPGAKNPGSDAVPGAKDYSGKSHERPILPVSAHSQCIDFYKKLVNASHMIETTSDEESWLIADVGATSSRCAMLAAGSKSPSNVRVYRNENFPALASLLADYLDTCDVRPQSMALAVAAPVHSDDVQMINRDWSFSRKSLSHELGLGRTTIINDFHAIAYALPTLDDESRVEIGKASEYRAGNMAVLGPGSGLGMAAWISNDAGGSAMTGEGGHISVSGRNDEEDAIIAWFRERYGHCSAERILSGPGLVALHEALHGVKIESPEAITASFFQFPRQCCSRSRFNHRLVRWPAHRRWHRSLTYRSASQFAVS